MSNMNDQLGRMKAMMNYGMTTENKKENYCSVEYHNDGADGKRYGIVREGTKYYIKIAPKKNQIIKEEFEYIGGFVNRKDNEYSSYANALKNLDLKLMSIKENHKGNNVIIESWNPDKQEFLALESTEKMQQEIQRQRQIMNNSTMISEQKPYKATIMEEKPKGVNTTKDNDPFQDKSGNKDAVASQKNNIGKGKDEGKKGKKGCEDYTMAKVEGSVACQKPKGGKMVKESEVLGWNDNADYLDKTKGTTIGDSAPYTNCVGKKSAPCKETPKTEATETETQDDAVNEVAMHQEGENQNSPKVGVGEIGDSAPFDKKVNEEDEDDEADEMIEEALSDFGDDDEFGGEDETIVGDEFGGEEMEDEDVPFGEDEFSSLDGEDEEMDSRITSIEDMLSKIAEKLGISEPMGDAMNGDEFGDDSEENDLYSDEEEMQEPIEDSRFYESRKYKIAMLEDRLDDFGKHPAYQKKVMELPPANLPEKEGYYDMNDDSVKSEKPFGEKIGDSAPFNIKPADIQNAIAESLSRLLKKKK